MYSSDDILNAMGEDRIQIEPFDKKNLGANSYDLTLDGVFFILTNKLPSREPYFLGPIWASPGQPIYLRNGETILGRTVERVGTFHNVVGKLFMRSTVARCGMEICGSAGLGDVGYNDRWTVELTANSGDWNAFLIVGERFCQISFFETKTPPIANYNGQYKATKPDYLSMIPRSCRDNIILPSQADVLRLFHPYL